MKLYTRGLFQDWRNLAVLLYVESFKLNWRGQYAMTWLILYNLNVFSVLQFKTINILLPLILPEPYQATLMQTYLKMLLNRFLLLKQDIPNIRDAFKFLKDFLQFFTFKNRLVKLGANHRAFNHLTSIKRFDRCLQCSLCNILSMFFW